jgi:hypothetical protein
MAGDDEITDLMELSTMSVMFFMADIEDADLERSIRFFLYVGRDNLVLA